MSKGKQFAGRRILIVRDRASAGGGIHAYYQAISPHLQVQHEFLDVGRPHACYETNGDVGGAGIRNTILRIMCEWLALVGKLIRFPDLVHLNPGLDIEMRSLWRDAINLRLAKLFRRPVLLFWRGWDHPAAGGPEFPGGNNGWLARTYRRADANVVLARDFDRDLRRWKFTAPITVETTVVPDAVMAAGSAHELLSQCVNLLFLSRIEVAKGVFELLDAFCLLQARQPGRYRLTFAGDGPALSELKERARDLGIENVIFPGFVTGEEKLACYRSADVFCFLSYTEGMPNAVLEAMAMGLPIVSSAVGGLKDILQEDNSGYIVPQFQDKPLRARFSASEIADRIQRIAADKMLYRRISRHNRRYAEQRFAAKTVAGRLERIYGEVFSPSAAPQVVSQQTAEVRT